MEQLTATWEVSQALLSLLGPGGGRKFIHDEAHGEEPVVTSDAYKILQAMPERLGIVSALIDMCDGLNKSVGSGQVEAVAFAGILARHVQELVHQGIPMYDHQRHKLADLTMVRRSAIVQAVQIWRAGIVELWDQLRVPVGVDLGAVAQALAHAAAPEDCPEITAAVQVAKLMLPPAAGRGSADGWNDAVIVHKRVAGIKTAFHVVAGIGIDIHPVDMPTVLHAWQAGRTNGHVLLLDGDCAADAGEGASETALAAKPVVVLKDAPEVLAAARAASQPSEFAKTTVSMLLKLNIAVLIARGGIHEHVRTLCAEHGIMAVSGVEAQAVRAVSSLTGSFVASAVSEVLFPPGTPVALGLSRCGWQAPEDAPVVSKALHFAVDIHTSLFLWLSKPDRCSACTVTVMSPIVSLLDDIEHRLWQLLRQLERAWSTGTVLIGAGQPAAVAASWTQTMAPVWMSSMTRRSQPFAAAIFGELATSLEELVLITAQQSGLDTDSAVTALQRVQAAVAGQRDPATLLSHLKTVPPPLHALSISGRPIYEDVLSCIQSFDRAVRVVELLTQIDAIIVNS